MLHDRLEVQVSLQTAVILRQLLEPIVPQLVDELVDLRRHQHASSRADVLHPAGDLLPVLQERADDLLPDVPGTTTQSS
jgi:hypothetical protein